MDKNVKKWQDENARLMKKAVGGDREAFDCLSQRLAPLLLHLFVKWGVNPNSADDLAQEVFIRLWRRRKTYRLGSSLEAYLCSIAKNILHEEIRRSHKIDGTGLKKRPVSDEGKYNGMSQPEAEVSLRELTEDIEEEKKTKLTKEQYQALQIAQDPDIDLPKKLKELGWSTAAYNSQLQRARKKVRENLTPIFLENLNPKKPRKRPQNEGF